MICLSEEVSPWTEWNSNPGHRTGGHTPPVSHPPRASRDPCAAPLLRSAWVSYSSWAPLLVHTTAGAANPKRESIQASIASPNRSSPTALSSNSCPRALALECTEKWQGRRLLKRRANLLPGPATSPHPKEGKPIPVLSRIGRVRKSA